MFGSRGSGSSRPMGGTGSRSGSSDPVFAVGWRALVTSPAGASRRVTLMQADGITAVGTVTAGVEVEILAWQPRGAGGTRYRVHAAAAGVEGWLAAASLTPVRRPVVAPRMVPPPSVRAPRPVAAPRSAVPARPVAAPPRTAVPARPVAAPRTAAPARPVAAPRTATVTAAARVAVKPAKRSPGGRTR